jgi:hypothetical protein
MDDELYEALSGIKREMNDFLRLQCAAEPITEPDPPKPKPRRKAAIKAG